MVTEVTGCIAGRRISFTGHQMLDPEDIGQHGRNRAQQHGQIAGAANVPTIAIDAAAALADSALGRQYKEV